MLEPPGRRLTKKNYPMKYWYGLLLVAFLASCQDPIYTPKPRGYPKVEYPEKAYVPFSEGYCDLSFEYPRYAEIQRDTVYLNEKPAHPCWFDIFFPSFDARLHCTYAPVGEAKSFEELRSDAFELANWHNKKASYIEENLIENQYGSRGLTFEFEGPVASQFQFFLTDSLHRHFFRGALYFNAEARPDSLAPIYEFLRQDVDRMLSTFQWKD